MSPMALMSWSKVLAPMRRRWDFNFEKAISIGEARKENSLGDCFQRRKGRENRRAGTASSSVAASRRRWRAGFCGWRDCRDEEGQKMIRGIIFPTQGRCLEPGRARVGSRQVSKASRSIAPAITHGATRASLVSPRDRDPKRIEAACRKHLTSARKTLLASIAGR